MKLLEHSKSTTGYKIRIWLDETKFDLQGAPYEEWVLDRTWGLEPPMNAIEDGEDADGKPKFKYEPAMTQDEYEKDQLEQATGLAQELLAKINGKGETVTQPRSL